MVIVPWPAFSSTETASLPRVQDRKTWRKSSDTYLTSMTEANRNKLLEEPSEEERYQRRLALRCAHEQRMSSHHYEPRKWWGHSTAQKQENPVALTTSDKKCSDLSEKLIWADTSVDKINRIWLRQTRQYLYIAYAYSATIHLVKCYPRPFWSWISHYNAVNFAQICADLWKSGFWSLAEADLDLAGVLPRKLPHPQLESEGL